MSPTPQAGEAGDKAEAPYTWGHYLVKTDAGTKARVTTKLFGVPGYDRRKPLYASDEDVYETLKTYTSVDLGRLHAVSRVLLKARPELFGAGPSDAPGSLTPEAIDRLLAGSSGSVTPDTPEGATPAAATARSESTAELTAEVTPEPTPEPPAESTHELTGNEGNEPAGHDGAASEALNGATLSASRGATSLHSVATPPEGVKPSPPDDVTSAPLGRTTTAPGDLPSGSPGRGQDVTDPAPFASADPADARNAHVTFGCGHRATLPVSNLDPLQLERELEPYRQGPCLSCIAVNLSVLTRGVTVWEAPDLVVSRPQLAALAERRRFERVRDFVDDLARAPERVLEAYYSLQFEVRSVLGDDDGDTWRACPHRVQDLVWIMAELSNDQLVVLGHKPRGYDPARSRALATLLAYREYEKRSPFGQWLSRVGQPRRYRGFG